MLEYGVFFCGFLNLLQFCMNFCIPSRSVIVRVVMMMRMILVFLQLGSVSSQALFYLQTDSPEHDNLSATQSVLWKEFPSWLSQSWELSGCSSAYLWISAVVGLPSLEHLTVHRTSTFLVFCHQTFSQHGQPNEVGSVSRRIQCPGCYIFAELQHLWPCQTIWFCRSDASSECGRNQASW